MQVTICCVENHNGVVETWEGKGLSLWKEEYPPLSTEEWELMLRDGEGKHGNVYWNIGAGKHDCYQQHILTRPFRRLKLMMCNVQVKWSLSVLAAGTVSSVPRVH